MISFGFTLLFPILFCFFAVAFFITSVKKKSISHSDDVRLDSFEFDEVGEEPKFSKPAMWLRRITIFQTILMLYYAIASALHLSGKASVHQALFLPCFLYIILFFVSIKNIRDTGTPIWPPICLLVINLIFACGIISRILLPLM